MTRTRIAICGISSESCGFSRHTTGRAEFVELRGEELLTSYGMHERIRPDLGADVEWLPVLSAAATPGGQVEPAKFDQLLDEICAGLAQHGGLDGVYLDLHGAVKVRGREHAEEQLVRRIRGVVGAKPVISASMDPHGNLSAELARLLDLACAHRHSPHIDQAETKTRAIENLLRVVRSGRRPVKAWVRIPVLLPGERTATIVEPGRSVFAYNAVAAAQDGIVDANTWTGFAWADEPRCTASVLVTAHDEHSARAGAERLARRYWDARSEFGVVSTHYGSFDQALDFVSAGAQTPCFISDSGDNITAGASGDTTYALRRVLDRADLAAAGKNILIAGLYDPAAVDGAVSAGIGGVLDHAVGAWLDDRFGGPVPGPWTVRDLITGPFDQDVTAAVLSNASVSVSVQARRVLFGTPEDAAAWPFDMHGLSPVDVSGYDAVVVKNGYLLPSQVTRAGSAFLAATPGPTDIDTARLPYRRLQRPMYPLDADFSAALTAEVIPTWQEGRYDDV